MYDKLNMKHRFYFLLFCLVVYISGRVQTHKNVFLVGSQIHLIFPHREIPYLQTYNAKCQTSSHQNITQYPPLMTLSTIYFNNTNLAINILPYNNFELSPHFYYGKINKNGICSIYEVTQNHIKLLYQYNFLKQYVNLIVINKLSTFLWNRKSFSILQYSLYNSELIIHRSNFTNNDHKKCSRNGDESIICWSYSQIYLISFISSQINTTTYTIDRSDIDIILFFTLIKKHNIMFMCTDYQCKILQLQDNSTILILQQYDYLMKVIGGSYNQLSKKISLVFEQDIISYRFKETINQLQVIQNFNIKQYINCNQNTNIHLQRQYMLINCINQNDQQQNLVIKRDIQRNQYHYYQLYRQQQNKDKDISKDKQIDRDKDRDKYIDILHDNKDRCEMEANSNYFYIICQDRIIIKDNNFQYIVVDTNIKSMVTVCQYWGQQQQTRVLNCLIKPVEYNLVYVDVEINKYLNVEYDNFRSIGLSDKFIANAIEYYSVDSPNCPYIDTSNIKKIDYLYYISLYNRQKCVQIASNNNQRFYRLIEINATLYYIQSCSIIKHYTQISNELGYVCELSQILQQLFNLRIFVYQDQLYKFYLKDNNLMKQSNGIIQKISKYKIEMFEMKDNIIIIKWNQTYYYDQIVNVIINCCHWVTQNYTQGTIPPYGQFYPYLFNTNPKIYALIQNIMKQRGINKSSYNPQLKILPFYAKNDEYIFIINQTHITKIYSQNEIRIIYELPYNRQRFEISQIRKTLNYIIIQYQVGYFELYNLRQYSISALQATVQQQILSDLILMDSQTLLIPIKSQTYMIIIYNHPQFNFQPLLPFYNKFSDKCQIIITPVTSNGSCPTGQIIQKQQIKINQSFYLYINFNIQDIYLDSTISLHTFPMQCQHCVIDINQNKFLGPIFSYNLNDDYFGTFQLVSHLNIVQCLQSQKIFLSQMDGIKNQQLFAQDQIMNINMTHIVFVNMDLNPIFQIKLAQEMLCISYLNLKSYYIVLCDRYFVIFNKTGALTYSKHNFTIVSILRSEYTMQALQLQSFDYNLYLSVQDKYIYTFFLTLNDQQITYVSQYSSKTNIQDFKIINNLIIILNSNSICLFSKDLTNYQCRQLQDIVPQKYAKTFQYQSLTPYFSNQTYIKALLISKNIDNLHIDFGVHIKTPCYFEILNVYAGYKGYIVKQLVSINITDVGYTNFILYFQQNQSKVDYLSCFVAYYQYNLLYQIDQTIGYIREAEILDNYFNLSHNFNFLSFKNKLFINYFRYTGKDDDDLLYRTCLQLKIEDKLYIISHYQTPPIISFLILKAINKKDLQSHYFKITFQEDNNILTWSLIGFAIYILLFVLLAIATYRCKKKYQIQYDAQQSSGWAISQKSDLLHSPSISSADRSIDEPLLQESPEDKDNDS